MPLKLIRMNEEVIAKIDAEKELKPSYISKVTMRFYWKECPYLKKTNMESKHGVVLYCSFEDRYSNSERTFSCQLCDKYKIHKRLTELQW